MLYFLSFNIDVFLLNINTYLCNVIAYECITLNKITGKEKENPKNYALADFVYII